MRSTIKANPGYASPWLPVVFALAVAVALSFVAIVQRNPIMGDVLSVERGSDGLLYATVSYETAKGDGFETVVERMVMPRAYEGADEVPVRPGDDSTEPRVGLFGYIEVTITVIVISSAFAALLGKVVQLTVRGYGYVPGTAQPGQTDPELVAEDRGFYWRT